MIIITLLLMINFSYYMFIIPVLFIIFTRYKIYKIIFNGDSVIFRYIYFIKKIITKDQIVRIYINQNSTIEFSWKKDSKHSTKVIKIPLDSFLNRNMTIDDARYFFRTTYNR